MEIAELIKKVRRIEIKAKGLTNEMFSGEYHSAFKGRGMSFSEVREYQFGDDIRNIDWNVTARFDHPYVKVYEEERENTVMLLLDMSASGLTGSHRATKNEILTELAAVIAFSVSQNNDKIGAILFTDQVEQFIPPRKGKAHVLRIIRDILNFEPERLATSLQHALGHFTRVVKKKCTAFLISDFIDHNFEDALRMAARKHDLICLQLNDPIEKKLPEAGLVKMKDAESGHMIWIDTGSRNVRNKYFALTRERDEQLRQFFTRSGIDYASIDTSHSYIKPLHNLFKKRGKKR